MAAVRCTIAAAVVANAWGLQAPLATPARQTSLSAQKRPDYVPGVISDPGYVRIFDTTLRDGEQSPGATLTSNEKLDIARMLAKLGVDIIEAGFPIASPDDFDAVNQIARVVGNEVDADGYVPVICGLSRANPKDIERAWEAVKPAQRPRVHTFIATSPIHMETKLKKTPEEVLQIAVDAVKFAKSLGCDDIEFSPEDAGRSDPEFLIKVLSAVVDAGATTLNIPDTTGWNVPWEFGPLIQQLREGLGDKADRVVFSTHCQNDLGLSTANSIAGAAHGARQIECTINGIGDARRPAVPSRHRRASSPGMMEVGGFFFDFEANTMLRAGERAGNAALEEVVMALALKGPTHFGEKGPTGSGPDLRTGIDPVHITPTSNMVKEYTGMAVQPHKAIVGANAFQHESGIHQDGMLPRVRIQNRQRDHPAPSLMESTRATPSRFMETAARRETPAGMIKNKQTYEIMTPESIGLMRGDQQSGAGIVLGKHSGRNAVSTRLNELGYDLDDDKLQSVFVRFKEVAERKKGGLDDDDLEALVADEVYSAQAMWRLERVQVTTGSGVVPTATVALTGPDGVERQGVAMGTGPVDAAYKAIDALTSVKVHLETYSMESVNAGIEAMATTKVVVNPVDSATSLHSSGYTTSRKFSGSGSDTDVVVSSARAYVAAVNKLIRWNMRRAAAEQVEAQEA